MLIRNLDLQNFRNYTKLNLEFAPGINIIVAPNGSGKTSIIEAISYLSVPKSFRRVLDRNLIRKDIMVDEIDIEDLSADLLKAVNSFARCIGVISNGGYKIEKRSNFNEGNNDKLVVEDADVDIDELEFFIQHNSGTQKILKVNGKKEKTSKFVGRLYSVIFSPEIIDLINSSPSKRRYFLDRLISTFDPVYLSNLSKFKEILRSRNRILSDTGVYRNSVMEFWDSALIELGSEILWSRINFFDEIQSRIQTVGKEILSTQYDFDIRYLSFVVNDSDISTDFDSLEDIQSYFSEKVTRSRSSDARRGTTTVGPHRDDFSILMNEYDLSDFGSRGQQRIGLLSFLFSYVQYLDEIGKRPILLLDDVFSELDKTHRRMLLDFINNKDFQVIITATELGGEFKNISNDYNFINLE